VRADPSADVRLGSGGDALDITSAPKPSGQPPRVIFGGRGLDVVRVLGVNEGDAVMIDLRVGIATSGDTSGRIAGFENATGDLSEDVLIGDDGPNVLLGYYGEDRIVAGGGDDVVDGQEDADALDGGEGVDSTGYGDRRGPIVATLDAVADDGEPGEGDRIGADVEEVQGTHSADRMVGSKADNEFRAGDGDDVLVGGGGADHLSGEGGSDQIHALEGEPAVQHNPLPGIPIPGLTSYYDDSVSCDDARTPSPPMPTTVELYDPGEPGTNDTVLADSTDGVATGGATPFLGCEVVLHADKPVTVDPTTTTSVPVPAYCDAGQRDARCRATATVLVPGAGQISGARFKPPKTWQRLGQRSYEAKFGAKRKRVKVPVSRSAARKARGGKRVKAYVAYRYRKPAKR